MNILRPLLLVLLLIIVPLQAGAGNFVPRKLVALYDSRYEVNLRENVIHRFLELPSNRLGYDIEYIDINQPLPQLGEETHGILVWFTHHPVPQLEDYIAWLAQQVGNGKKLVVMEDMGIGRYDTLNDQSLARLKYIFEKIGVRDNGVWYPITHKSSVISRNPKMIDFERRLVPPLAPFGQTVATSTGTSHMRLSVSSDSPGEYADVIITGPQGGFAAPGYVYHEQDVNDKTVSAWYLNPFHFLEQALSPPRFPVPDVTTRNGLRIFYSHIDGDGWNNRSHIENYREKFSSRVVMKEILAPYSDFAFTLALVAGDVTDDCFGSEKSRAVARESLLLPNVEPASHTYTHPLYWQFFEDYTPEKEKIFASNFPKRAGLFRQDYSAMFAKDQLRQHKHDSSTTPSVAEMKRRQLEAPAERHMRRLLEMYDVPRSFNCVDFDEEREIVTAKEIAESLAPEGKKVRLLQWSGNTSPYERFLRKTREAGMYNINGGESRYDAEYPSYSTLYPIGIRVGNERQIYSTASNENTYTNLWSERFFGYRYLIETVRHTESPVRLAPFNVYFHSYSGERPGSLNALKEIMEYARKQDVIPLFTSHFAAIANGYYTARIEVLGKEHWRIHDRGELQTLRIPAPRTDGKRALAVDMSRSTGVLGQRMWQENLYISLNPSVDKPEIMLIQVPSEAKPTQMSLTSSRWDIISAERQSDTSITLQAQGFGTGEMQWRVPRNGTYTATITPTEGGSVSISAASENNVLKLDFGAMTAHSPVEIRITLKEAAQ